MTATVAYQYVVLRCVPRVTARSSSTSAWCSTARPPTSGGSRGGSTASGWPRSHPGPTWTRSARRSCGFVEGVCRDERGSGRAEAARPALRVPGPAARCSSPDRCTVGHHDPPASSSTWWRSWSASTRLPDAQGHQTSARGRTPRSARGPQAELAQHRADVVFTVDRWRRPARRSGVDRPRATAANTPPLSVSERYAGGAGVRPGTGRPAAWRGRRGEHRVAPACTVRDRVAEHDGVVPWSRNSAGAVPDRGRGPVVEVEGGEMMTRTGFRAGRRGRAEKICRVASTPSISASGCP